MLFPDATDLYKFQFLRNVWSELVTVFQWNNVCKFLNTLKSSGNCMYHLLQKSTNHVVRRAYLLISYDSQSKQRLFP
jgi:hypothetical protein